MRLHDEFKINMNMMLVGGWLEILPHWTPSQTDRDCFFPVFTQTWIFYLATPIKSTYHTSLKTCRLAIFIILFLFRISLRRWKFLPHTTLSVVWWTPTWEGRCVKGNISHTISCILCPAILTSISTPTQQTTKAKGKFPISSALLKTSYTELYTNKCLRCKHPPAKMWMISIRL